MEKSILKFLTCGSVDDGKSTLLGRLLFETKNIFSDQIDQLKNDSKNNKLDIDFSKLFDGLISEREQGITVDIAYRFFSTKKRKFIVLDTPGHVQYTRNMATAASSADLTIILIDSTKGISEQTKRHFIVNSLFGINNFLIAINKMDLIDYSQEIYNKISNEFNVFAKCVGSHTLKYIPISAINGENLTSISNNLSWYKGKSLIQILESYNLKKDTNSDDDFIMPIQLIKKSNEFGRVFYGKITNGKIKQNDTIKILPSKTETKISSFFSDKNKIFINGESVSLKFKDEVDCSRGDVICGLDSKLDVSDLFEINLIWMSKNPLIAGRQYWIKIGTKMTIGRIQKIKHKININDLSSITCKSLDLNDIGNCILITDEKVPFTPYKNNKNLGGLIVIDKETNDTVGAGLINFSLNRSKNLFYQKSIISEKDRSIIKDQKPCVIWLTGMSGSGKSTLANEIEKKLNLKNYHTYILDGDNIRLGLNKDLGFTEGDRAENIRRISEVSKLMNDAGLIVISAFISPFKEERNMAKKIIGADKFIEVFVDVSIQTAKKRDPKGLYKKALLGEIKNFTGIDSPYQKPEKPDIYINTNDMSINDSVEKILSFFYKNHTIKR